MRIGTVIGGILLAIAVLFAAIDSYILYRGWSQWGLEEWDRISFGIAAASIPWAIGLFPFLFWYTWRPGRWLGIGRPSLTTLVAAAVWGVLIAYNILGAMGAIATQRGQVIADRVAAADTIDALKNQRRRLEDQLGWIPKRRPAGQVEALIEAEKLKWLWQRTDECRDIRGSTHRRYCTGVAVLEGELEAARKSDQLVAKLEALNTQIAARAPVARDADPMASTLASWTGIDEQLATQRLPIATPLILLIGEMTFAYFGLLLMGLDHRQLASRGVTGSSVAGREPGEADRVPAPPQVFDPPRAPAVPEARAPRDSITRQRELAEWFFRECSRPAPAGSLTEDAWYRHYQDVCGRSGDTALPLAAFRRIAERCEGLQVREVAGTTFYAGVLPVVPREEDVA